MVITSFCAGDRAVVPPVDVPDDTSRLIAEAHAIPRHSTGDGHFDHER
jgi:hypothetical protein